MSLFSLIQTHSVDQALQPIAEKVRTLKDWTQVPIDQNFASIFQPATSVLEAVQQLAQAAQKQISDGDEDVQKDMKPAFEQTLVAAQHLIEAAKQIEKSTPPVNCQLLCSATQDILEGSVKMLLAWDGGEIRKIIGIAQWTKDRLKLVQVAPSMRALIVCYNGFFDAMRQLITTSTQRYQDIIDESKKEKLFSCLIIIRKSLPDLSQSMQDYIRNPDTKRQKKKDNCCQCILKAIDGIIESVSMPEEQEEEDENDLYNISESSDLLSDEDESETETIAINLKKVQEQLSSSRRATNIGPQLDANINTIIENSKMVARESEQKFKEHIHYLCQEVLSIREDLEVHYKAYLEDPTSEEKRVLFNKTVDKLCSKLEELDGIVATSVADQVAQAYVQPSAAIDHLMGAIVTSSSPVDDVSADSMDGLKQTVKVFRQHSRRLSKVAIHAAQGTLNRKRSKRIKKLTTQLDEVTRKVVSAAIEVRNNPHDFEKRRHLDELRREWAEKVKDLTKAIDEIINIEDFTAATEATIVDDMAKCRQATETQSWVELEATVHGIEAKAKRLIEVSKRRTSSAVDNELKNEIHKATNNLEQVMSKMTNASKRIIDTTAGHQEPDEGAMKELVESLQQVLACIHQVQKLLSNVTTEPTEYSPTSVPVTPVTTAPKRLPPPSTSTPLETWDSSSPSPPPPSSLPPSLPPTDSYYDRPILSPSDDWIRSSSFETTSPSSFAPTNPSAVYDPFPNEMSTIMTPPYSHQPIITYPSTLGGATPSYLGAATGTISWQQDDIPLSGDHWGKEKPPDSAHLLESYVVPLKGVITAAAHSNSQELHSKASVLTAQTQQLSKLAESAAASTQNHDTARILNKTSAQLSHLTPRIIKAAEQLVDNKGDSDTLEQLRQQWTGHVNTLLEASQDANMPWSQTARRLVTSAKTRKGLDKEVSHVNSQTGRMVSVAATSIRAATIEDAIGSTANLDHAQDPIVQEQIEKVRSQVEIIESMTPDMISTAQTVAHGQPHEDKLHLLSHEWATTASGLMKGVDDITIGMSGPADTLIIAANSNDAILLEQQAVSIKRIADSMLAIAQDAVQGCDNEEQVSSVLETAEMLQKLSGELAECAYEIASLLPDKRGQEEHQITVERGEILRRDWAAKMHLLTAYIDDLTAGVAGPLDKLISVALQASRTDGMAKDHLLKQFDKKEEFVTKQLEEVNNQLQKVSKEHSLIDCIKCMRFLQDASPHAIGAARSLATDPSSTKLDHFSHLRRQWAAKAQSFYSSLLKASETIDVTPVISAFEDLLQGYRTTRTTPSTYKQRGSKWQQDSSVPPLPQPRYYSTEDIEPPSYPPPPVPSVDDSYLGYKQGGGSDYPWTTDTSGAENDMIETSLNRSLVVAAKSLRSAVEEFEEEGNPLVTLAKSMSEQMYQMAEFTCGRGKLKSMKEMIDMSKQIAESAKKIVRYAEMISKHCTDKRIKNDLQYCVKMIPTLSNQLNIIASVKFSTMAETDLSRADKMLEKNAQNLMIAVVQTIKAAEAAYVKGLTSPTVSEDEDIKVIEWKKKKLHHHGANNNVITAKGLRRLKKDRHSSLVSQVLHFSHI